MNKIINLRQITSVESVYNYYTIIAFYALDWQNSLLIILHPKSIYISLHVASRCHKKTNSGTSLWKVSNDSHSMKDLGSQRNWRTCKWCSIRSNSRSFQIFSSMKQDIVDFSKGGSNSGRKNNKSGNLSEGLWIGGERKSWKFIHFKKLDGFGRERGSEKEIQPSDSRRRCQFRKRNYVEKNSRRFQSRDVLVQSYTSVG